MFIMLNTFRLFACTLQQFSQSQVDKVFVRDERMHHEVLDEVCQDFDLDQSLQRNFVWRSVASSNALDLWDIFECFQAHESIKRFLVSDVHEIRKEHAEYYSYHRLTFQNCTMKIIERKSARFYIGEGRNGGVFVLSFLF
jgi:hypothetical protein